MSNTFTRSINPIVCFSILVCFQGFAYAQDIMYVDRPGAPEQTDVLFVNQEKVHLSQKPGTKRIGSVQRNVPVTILQQKGDWTRVSVVGWVKKSFLSKEKVKVKKQRPKSSKLSLSDFKLKHSSSKDTGGPARTLLTLFVKNNSTKKISAWKGVLIVTSVSGAPILKQNVTHEDADIKPGEVGDVSFYWEEGEREFDELYRVPERELKVRLVRIKTSQ